MTWLRRHWLRLISCAALLAAIPACTGQQSNSTGPQWSSGDGTPDMHFSQPSGTTTLQITFTPAVEVNGGTITYTVLGCVGQIGVDSGKEVPLTANGGTTTGTTVNMTGITPIGPWIFQLQAVDGFGNVIVSPEIAYTET